VPKTRTEWWLSKINHNIENDNKVIAALRAEKWKVITVWECDLKPAFIERTLTDLISSFTGK
jgi:DNA mismatch endonuclease (patch repair protein)